jgi:hypothetical protein
MRRDTRSSTRARLGTRPRRSFQSIIVEALDAHLDE